MPLNLLLVLLVLGCFASIFVLAGIFHIVETLIYIVKGE